MNERELNEQVKIAIITVIGILLVGTVVFHYLEDWPWVTSFYFTTMTVTTVGYGDLTPTNAVSQIFSALFALTSVGLAFYSLTIIAQHRFHYTHFDKLMTRFHHQKKVKAAQARALQSVQLLPAEPKDRKP